MISYMKNIDPDQTDSIPSFSGVIELSQDISRAIAAVDETGKKAKMIVHEDQGACI